MSLVDCFNSKNKDKKMAKKKIETLIEDKTTKQIYLDYVREKALAKKVGKGTAEAGALTAYIAGFTLLDFTMTIPVLYLIFHTEVHQATTKAGQKIDDFRIGRKGKKEITMKNFADQEVTGRVDTVLALMAMQEEIIKLDGSRSRLDETENFNAENRIGKIIRRMRKEAEDVTVEMAASYKILSSREEIKRYKLEDHVEEMMIPDRKLLKQSKKPKKPKSP